MKRALVSGAASGIGLASARALGCAGWHVTGLDVAARAGPADAWVACDLSRPDTVSAGLPAGPFDALVNAAGLPPRAGAEARLLAVNVFGLIALTEAMLPHMRPGSAIVSLASKAGGRWRDNVAQVRRLLSLRNAGALPRFVTEEDIGPVRAYDLSKEAVIAWTKAATARLKDMDLRANTVSPAAVETPILRDFEAAFGERAAAGTALMGRPGTADEVAGVVAFLAASESGWVKGVDVPVDGGLDAMREAARLLPEAEEGDPRWDRSVRT